MKPVDEALDMLVPRFSHLPGFKYRKMFGGASLYSDGLVFCLITNEGIPHFRIADSNIQDYIDAGQEAFSPKMKNAKGVMPYYTIPEEVIEDQLKLEEWAEKAIRAAREAKSGKK
ncbi:MAG: TfoX/Sxy family protein [Saprospiraceae bacterium]|nr:TfoX/Sxy family protein [Saprospiraceae bacterium]